MQRDIHFLVDYINVLVFSKGEGGDDADCEDELRVVWKYEGVETVLEELFDLFSKKTIYLGCSEHFCNSFFNKLEGPDYNKAKQFLLEYCRKNYTDTEKMNIVVDITKNSMKELYREVLLLFVSLTQNVDLFSKIYWNQSSSCYAGKVIIGSKKATEWNHVLEIINESPLRFRLRSIKGYINSMINTYERYAENEKRNRFIGSG